MFKHKVIINYTIGYKVVYFNMYYLHNAERLRQTNINIQDLHLMFSNVLCVFVLSHYAHLGSSPVQLKHSADVLPSGH